MTIIFGIAGQLWLNGEPWPMGQLVTFRWEFDQSTLTIERPQPEQHYWLRLLFEHHQADNISLSAVVQNMLVVIPVIEPSAVLLIDDIEKFGFSAHIPFGWNYSFKLFPVRPGMGADWNKETARREIRQTNALDRRYYSHQSETVGDRIQSFRQEYDEMMDRTQQVVEVGQQRLRCLAVIPPEQHIVGIAACDRLATDSPIGYDAMSRMIGAGVLMLAEDGLRLDSMDAATTLAYFRGGHSETAAVRRHEQRQRNYEVYRHIDLSTPPEDPTEGLRNAYDLEAGSDSSFRHIDSREAMRQEATRVLRERREAVRRWRYEPRHIGDLSCINNARDPHLRCAINPCGPCEGCLDYETR